MFLVLSVIGLLTSPRWDKRSTTMAMITWIAACYLTFTFIGHKEARYVLYWLPPFTYVTAVMRSTMFRERRARIEFTGRLLQLGAQPGRKSRLAVLIWNKVFRRF